MPALSEFIIEDAVLAGFGELGYAVGHDFLFKCNRWNLLAIHIRAFFKGFSSLNANF
jgi:hypothetical protein